MRHIISILVENKFGVLARIAGMFSGRGFNIETLNVGPMLDNKLSRITATIVGDSDNLDQAIKQVNKLINVLEVTTLLMAKRQSANWSCSKSPHLQASAPNSCKSAIYFVQRS